MKDQKNISKKRENINIEKGDTPNPKRFGNGGEDMPIGYRQPNVDNFLKELEDNRRAIIKFKRFINKSLSVSSETLKKVVQG